MAGEVLWRPSPDRIAGSNMARYLARQGASRGLRFDSYEEAWRWSVTDLEGFWASVWDHFAVEASQPSQRVLGSAEMPGAQWFPGARLNYAERALARTDDHPAIVFADEETNDGTGPGIISYAELGDRVARAAAHLRTLGVGLGDRVAAYVPNRPEAVVAFLAAASLGGIWSSCAPEFGVRSVVDRFRQIEPAVLIATEGYRYGGTFFDKRGDVEEIRRQLPSVRAVLRPAELGTSVPTPGDGPPVFAQVPFDHPLWILYSSGTTGIPKPIVHGHGGILLEHLKAASLHFDLRPADRFFWYSTTGWMMWNFLLSGLLLGATVVLYDGSPGYPDLGALWRLAEAAGITYFGTSAPFLLACMKTGVRPAEEADLSQLRGVGSTGAPLPAEGFRWVYDTVKGDLALGSFSGGTDVCTGFVGPCPLLPVYAGEIQCRMLGAAVEAFDPAGRPVIGETGELVLTQPLPSMPVSFWNDPGGRRYRESYFDAYPGVWRHGDWITVTERGTCIISGRSDATLNRGGVRMGTAEFYAVVDEIPGISDSLVVDTGSLKSPGELVLFVALRNGVTLDDGLTADIKRRLRAELSPRHVPDRVVQVLRIPRTPNGKKLEAPVRRLLMAEQGARQAIVDASADPVAMGELQRALEGVGWR